ncbi:MAG: class A beta-lactamase-related serine hydrolase [Solobacterium sp.]|nr:class A beta-lactamase-related serine hydrolase [Solobacterium sp.]
MNPERKLRIKSSAMLAVFAVLTAVSACLANLPLKSLPEQQTSAYAEMPAAVRSNPASVQSEKPGPAGSLNELLNRMDKADGNGGLWYSPSVRIDDGVLLVLYDIMDRLESEGYRFGFVCTDLTTGETVSFNEDEKFYTASSIKAFYAVSLLKAKPEVLKNYTPQLSRMLIWSNNDDYAELRRTFRKEYIRQFCTEAHADPAIADEMYPYISAMEMAKLWACIYDWIEEGSEEARTVAEWFETPNRSSIRDVTDSNVLTRTKGGWIYYIGEDGTLYSETNDAGIVYEKGHPYILAVMTDVPDDYEIINPLTAVLTAVHRSMNGESAG